MEEHNKKIEAILEELRNIRAAIIAGSRLRDVASAALVNAFVQGTPGLVVSMASKEIIFSTTTADELFGYDIGELVGKSVQDLIPDRLKAVHQEHLDRYTLDPSIRLGKCRPTMLTGKRKDGGEIPVEISLNPVVIVTIISDKTKL